MEWAATEAPGQEGCYMLLSDFESAITTRRHQTLITRGKRGATSTPLVSHHPSRSRESLSTPSSLHLKDKSAIPDLYLVFHSTFALQRFSNPNCVLATVSPDSWSIKAQEMAASNYVNPKYEALKLRKSLISVTRRSGMLNVFQSGSFQSASFQSASFQSGSGRCPRI